MAQAGSGAAPLTRRTFLSTGLSAALGAALGGITGYGATQAWAQTPQRIAIQAQKFEFTPAEITLQRGRPATLVLSALDFDHGFSCPDFKIRSDFVPGKEIELTFTPDKTGRFLFTCDNFCGEGHDDMSGVIIVMEA